MLEDACINPVKKFFSHLCDRCSTGSGSGGKFDPGSNKFEDLVELLHPQNHHVLVRACAGVHHPWLLGRLDGLLVPQSEGF